MLKSMTPRLYQETILAQATKANTLVVLPTGLGKTVIALMLAAQRLKQHPGSKFIFLAPTRPLVEQHLETFKKHYDIDPKQLAIFTGSVRPEKRKELFKNKSIIFSTPQGFENDILTRKICLDNVSCIVFDEAHRAVGEYAYCFIAKEYMQKAKYPRVLALTASPGGDIEKITEVCTNLGIESVELRSDVDPDVKPYVKEVDIDWIKVSLPEEFKQVQKYLKECYNSKLAKVQKYGYVRNQDVTQSKVQILKMQGYLQSEIARGDRSMEILRSVSLLAEALKVEHAVELLESQGLSPTVSYLQGILSASATTKIKAVKNLSMDPNFRAGFMIAKRLFDEGVEHPKIAKLIGMVKHVLKENPSAKIIIFSQYRDSAKNLRQFLTKESISSGLFVGQQKRNGTGLSQKEQKAMLDDFREGRFTCLIATSVAEEGIDIPKVDKVIFYEPVPSGIRTIQRRGRTGRQAKGSVSILVAAGTRDEAYRWTAYRKEKRMHRELATLRDKFKLFKRPKNTLDRFINPEHDIKIFADFREKASGIVKELHGMGCHLELSSMTVGDYLLSPRVVVELKKVADFVDSIVDGRLLNQIKRLHESYPRPILILEGDQDIYAQRNVHPNAIRGMLSTIMVSYGIPVFQTKDFKDTASLLLVIAKREQEENSGDFNPHASNKPSSLSRQQEYLVSAIPGVGPGLAPSLLKNFGTIKDLANARPEDLESVEKIGSKKSQTIRNLFNAPYKE